MGNDTKPGKHFSHLRNLLPNLRGLAILDNDGRGRTGSIDQGLETLYWSRYEAENYFITPELLRTYTWKQYDTDNLFEVVDREEVDGVLDGLVLESVFGGVEADFNPWKAAPPDLSRIIWESTTRQIKLSTFAEEYFRRLSGRLKRPMLLRKGQLHRLVQLVDPNSFPNEVVQKLEALRILLSGPSSDHKMTNSSSS